MVCLRLVLSPAPTYHTVQVMAGHSEASMYKELKHVIPTAATFGGAILSLSPSPLISQVLSEVELISSWL